MNGVKDWAVGQITKLTAELGFLERDDIVQLVDQLLKQDASSINETISGLLDFSRKDVKNFITELIERIEKQRRYMEESRKVQIRTDKATKAAQGVNQRATKKTTVRDLSKVKLASRQVCYCQCTQHPLVNNCVNCGKIVCEMEGEGPCLFCGAWVDREVVYDIREVIGEAENEEDESLTTVMALEYEKALQHRDKLIEYDVNAAKRLGVIDAKQDWFEESNNTWLNKDQRNYAS